MELVDNWSRLSGIKRKKERKFDWEMKIGRHVLGCGEIGEIRGEI
jgi:hypothetical protein